MKNLRFYIVFLFVLIALLLCACTDYAQKIKDEFDPDDASMAANEIKEISYGYMTDDRDGQEYRTVKIAGQEWMAQNLNYYIVDTYCYDDNYQNCDTYGRLYKWQDAQLACPYGWHLPSKDEFETLITVAGGYEIAGKTLKSTTGWWDTGKGEGGTDDFGFTVLPAGYINTNEAFISKTAVTLFWTSSVNVDRVYTLSFSYSDDTASMFLNDTKESKSIRCIRD